ncbi:hypothetical protein CBR_g23406 [Chara braunii]|uniref:Myb-like domain-containing protein n=1 Tax=Chara braunii TaxID=69332 RepID=A0A388L449_CHABU|nr:hypothetical protein CBR_g23406 [Chara braunii]|eukprot:GBG77080.1 hypothetical protein CBR_g23406 [Chara braunii]
MPNRTTPTEPDLRDDGARIPLVHPRPTVENITRGVSNMRAHNDGGAGDDADEGFREDVEVGDDDDDIPIRPLGKTGGRGKGRDEGAVRGRSVGRGGRGGISDDDGKCATYWSPEEQMALVRCKWEQEIHLAGLGHNYGRMRTKKWKGDDIAKHMAIAGRPKDADDCMKKWDNLFQNYKKIQSPNGVQLPRRGAVGGEFVGSEAGGDGCPEERSFAKDSDNNAGTGAGGGKRKNARQQALESIADVMDRHGELMSATIDSSSKRQCSIFMRQCDILEPEVAVQKAHYAAFEETERMMCHALTEIAAAIRALARTSPAHSNTRQPSAGDDDEPLHERRLCTPTQGNPALATTALAEVDERRNTGGLPATPSQPRQRDPGDDGGSVQRGGGGEVVAEACTVGGEAGGGAGAGALGTVAPVVAAREEATFVATAREEARGENKSDRDGGDPGSSRDHRPITAAASDLPRGCSGEHCSAHLFLHGWIFKSGNRPRGYNVAFEYSLESVATDIARAMWCGEEWCNIISATVCAHTIDLSMDLPLWFVGANIEDRPEDDDMAAYQESTVICVSHAFRAAVQMGAHIDGDFISYDRLCRVADCFKLLFAACMWIMRMAGDDPRSHYEAFYLADLVVKPTLVTSMHRPFDHRRSVVRAAKVVTDRLGKAKATFGEYPDYIPGWAPCDIGFRHDASITGPEDAKKLDWLGSGPPDGDITTTMEKMTRRRWGEWWGARWKR